MKNKGLLALLGISIVAAGYVYFNGDHLKKFVIKEDDKIKSNLEHISKNESTLVYSMDDLKSKNKTLTEENILLTKENKQQKITIANLENENSEIKVKNSVLADEIEKVSSKLEVYKFLENDKSFDNMKFLKSTKISSMNVGEWNLSNKEKEYIKTEMSKEKSFYEIIPIVDKSNYANDPNELKQLGLSRKRAALAVTVLKMLNPENKIYISTEVIVSQNGERGFIVNQFN